MKSFMNSVLVFCGLLSVAVVSRAEDLTDDAARAKWKEAVAKSESSRSSDKRISGDSIKKAQKELSNLIGKAKKAKVVRKIPKDNKQLVFLSKDEQQGFISQCQGDIDTLSKVALYTKLGNRSYASTLLSQMSNLGEEGEMARVAIRIVDESIWHDSETREATQSLPVLYQVKVSSTNPAMPKKNSIGVIDGHLKCFQVIDKDHFLMEAACSAFQSLPEFDKLFMVEGLDTSDMTDDCKLELNFQPFVVTGTYQYESLRGTRTVLRLKAIK